MLRSLSIAADAQLFLMRVCIASEPMWLNANAAELNGVKVDTAQTAHGEVRYLNGFTNGSESAVFTVESPADCTTPNSNNAQVVLRDTSLPLTVSLVAVCRPQILRKSRAYSGYEVDRKDDGYPKNRGKTQFSRLGR